MRILTQNFDKPNSQSISVYGEYLALRKALSMRPAGIIAEVRASKMLGRGGAAFPTGIKWEFARRSTDFPKYIVANADEGEPGTFKDKAILEKDPHRLLEGIIIAGYAIGASEGFIYTRAEYPKAKKVLAWAISEAEDHGYLGDNVIAPGFSFRIHSCTGAGAYVCGDETALLDSIEGFRGCPRLKPPYPTDMGLRNKPTVINNIETLANIPTIIKKGGEWYSKIGSPNSPGTKLMSVSGFVKRPGLYEVDTGTTLGELIRDYCGGVVGKFKAALPGGVSTKFVTQLDVPIDVPSLVDVGSLPGTGAVVVLNDTVSIVDAAKNCVKFFADESCGKCTPCREGTHRAYEILDRFSHMEGSLDDLGLLRELHAVMYDTANCGLGQSALNPVVSAIDKFEDEFKRCIG